MKKLIIPQRHYLVIGDKRDASFDESRFSGIMPLLHQLRRKLGDE